MVLKFETWKGRRVIVSRDENNKFQTFRKLKGSGIKTKNQAQIQLNKTGTFYEDRVRIGNTTTNVKGVDRVIKIGKTTSVISSKKPPTKTTAPYQYAAYVTWQLKKRIVSTKGFSDLVSKGGNKRQAFDRAYGVAVSDGVLTGGSNSANAQFITSERGVVVQGDERVHFKVNYEVQTYIKLG